MRATNVRFRALVLTSASAAAVAVALVASGEDPHRSAAGAAKRSPGSSVFILDADARGALVGETAPAMIRGLGGDGSVRWSLSLADPKTVTWASCAVPCPRATVMQTDDPQPVPAAPAVRALLADGEGIGRPRSTGGAVVVATDRVAGSLRLRLDAGRAMLTLRNGRLELPTAQPLLMKAVEGPWALLLAPGDDGTQATFLRRSERGWDRAGPVRSGDWTTGCLSADGSTALLVGSEVQVAGPTTPRVATIDPAPSRAPVGLCAVEGRHVVLGTLREGPRGQETLLWSRDRTGWHRFATLNGGLASNAWISSRTQRLALAVAGRLWTGRLDARRLRPAGAALDAARVSGGALWVLQRKWVAAKVRF